MNKLVSELVEITALIQELTERKKAIEAVLLTDGAEALKDTKLKSVEIPDENGNKVIYTEASALTIVSPEYLKQLFGNAFKDIISEETKTEYKVKKDLFKRMLTALYRNEFTRITTDEFWKQLNCSEDKKKALKRKLKGSDFISDRDNLINIGEFSEKDASDYAFLYADAVIWSAVITVCGLAGMPPTEDNINAIIHGVNISVAVEETSKIKLERVKDGKS